MLVALREFTKRTKRPTLNVFNDEKRVREALPSSEAINKLSDLLSMPSVRALDSGAIKPSE